jgi:hypothetical protein
MAVIKIPVAKKKKKVVKAATAPVVAPQTYTNTANAAPTTPTGPSAGTLNTLFPSTRMFEPENYSGSPLYKFQVQSGQDQLAKSLAAKGMTGSGSAIKQELNIPMMAAAQDTDRMTRIASENADRLKSFQDNEALRQERAGNNQWDRAYSLASLMASQSPWSEAVGGLNSMSGYKNDAGQANANYLRDAYQRIFASPGQSSFVPRPLPSGPDYSSVNAQAASANNSSNQGWLNLLAQGLGSFF